MTRDEIKAQVSDLLEKAPAYRAKIEKIIDSFDEPVNNRTADQALKVIKRALQSANPDRIIHSLEFLMLWLKLMHTFAPWIPFSILLVERMISLFKKELSFEFFILDVLIGLLGTMLLEKLLKVIKNKSPKNISRSEDKIQENISPHKVESRGEWRWKILSLIVGWVAILGLFALITYVSSLEVKDLDLWLHLKMGRWISHHGFVPNFDILSCSISGKPWVNHEWLFQVLVYQVQENFGFDGLIYMQTFVVEMTFVVLLFLGYSRERQWLVVLTLLMVLMVYQSRFTIRPDIFSLLFFVFDIYILSIYINQRWAVYALVGVQILWSNMHGFFFFGPLLVSVGIFSEFLKRRVTMPYEWNTIGRLNDEEYGTLKGVLPLLLLACCLNPLTIKGALYPLGVFFHLAGDNKIFFEHIMELQKPFTAASVFQDNFPFHLALNGFMGIFTDNYIYYKILIFISGITFIFNRRKIDISSLMVWLIFLCFSLAAIRNLIYFAVAAYMVFMVNAISISWEDIIPLRFTSDTFKYITGIAFKLLLIAWMYYGIYYPMKDNGYFDFDFYNRKSEFLGVSKRVFPYKAVDFLIQEKIKGNFFNDFNSGAYLIGRAYPNIKVFIDGRTEVYGAQFFETYQKIWKDGDRGVFEELQRKDNITGAFLNNAHQQIPRSVLKMFHSLKDWSIVYLDDDAVIFLKQTTANKPLIDRLSVNISNWKPKPMDLFRLGSKRIDPFPFTSRAYILETLGADQAAMYESREALRVNPDYAPAYITLGKIYNRRGDYSKAFDNYRMGAMYAQGDLQARLGLAQSYEHLKNYHEAVDQYQRLLEASPKDVQGYLGLARTYAEMGQDKKALGLLSHAPKLGVEDKVEVQKIRDIINKKVGVAPYSVQHAHKSK